MWHLQPPPCNYVVQLQTVSELTGRTTGSTSWWSWESVNIVRRGVSTGAVNVTLVSTQIASASTTILQWTMVPWTVQDCVRLLEALFYFVWRNYCLKKLWHIIAMVTSSWLCHDFILTSSWWGVLLLQGCETVNRDLVMNSSCSFFWANTWWNPW